MCFLSVFSFFFTQDALTNVDLEQISSDLSGTPSPYSLQSPTHPSPPVFIGAGAAGQSEHSTSTASQSQEPMTGLNSVSDIAAPPGFVRRSLWCCFGGGGFNRLCQWETPPRSFSHSKGLPRERKTESPIRKSAPS